MPLGHFLGRTGVDRKAPTRNPRSPVENATNPTSLKLEKVNGLSPLIRQDSTTTSPVQIAATAAPSSKPRLRFTVILPPHNARAQAGRAERVRLSTETESRPCLKHVG